MLFSLVLFLFIFEGLILCDHAHTSTCVTGNIKFLSIFHFVVTGQEGSLLKSFSFSRQSVGMKGESKPIFRMRCSSKMLREKKKIIFNC